MCVEMYVCVFFFFLKVHVCKSVCVSHHDQAKTSKTREINVQFNEAMIKNKKRQHIRSYIVSSPKEATLCHCTNDIEVS